MGEYGVTESRWGGSTGSLRVGGGSTGPLRAERGSTRPLRVNSEGAEGHREWAEEQRIIASGWGNRESQIVDREIA